MATSYETWLQEVNAALAAINMPFDVWQNRWAFDLQKEFNAGTTANDAAMNANKYWWYRQNMAMNQECLETVNCWLPRNHQGECEPF